MIKKCLRTAFPINGLGSFKLCPLVMNPVLILNNSCSDPSSPFNMLCDHVNLNSIMHHTWYVNCKEMCTIRKVCFSWNCFGCMAKYVLICSSSHFNNRYQIEKQYFKCGFTSELKMNGKESLPKGVSNLVIIPIILLAFFTWHMCVEHLSLLSIMILRFFHYINWLMSFSSSWLRIIDNVSFANDKGQRSHVLPWGMPLITDS